MRSEANRHILAIWDPLSSEGELHEAYRWWSREVALWARINNQPIPVEIYEYVYQDLNSGTFTQSSPSGFIVNVYDYPGLPIGQTETLLR